MDGERYTVELELKRVGDFGMAAVSAKIGAAETAQQKFKKGWDGFKDSISPIGSAIDNVASKLFSMAKTGAVIGGGALFAGATYGVTHLNNELEKATISIGTIFSANGIAAGVPQGMVLAKDTIAKMRIDAQKLPGEFEDLMSIFTTGAIPAFRSGASVDRFRDLAGKAMAAGKVAQMDNGQVAREFAQLMEGRAGSHNVFGMKLMGLSGDSAKKFNNMAADKRMTLISKELDKYSGAITAFGDSFDAQTSTLVDNLKGFGIKATGPLFNSVKGTLAEANAWFSTHQEQVDRFANHLGSGLNRAFQGGKHFIEEWWPSIERFGEKAYDRIASVWVDVKPYVDQFGDAIRRALDDPNGTIDKMIELAKLYAEFKATEGAASVGMDVIKAGAGVAQMLSAAKAMGWLGGAAGVAGTAAKVGIGAKLGGAAGAAAPYAAAAAIPAAVAGALWYGAFGGVATKEDHDKEANYAGIDKADAMFKKLDEQGMSFNDMMSTMRGEAEFMRAKFQDVTAAAFSAQFALLAIGRLQPMSADARDMDDTLAKNAALIAGPLKPAQEGKKPLDPKHKGGGGGTIQKVEIVVTSNQNPSRIARAVVGHIGRLQRNPGASPDVRNYAALEDI